ncbi:putative membrane protein [Acetobacteraceae bacterium AT-5844]|nr:putative membrane protein [Acetobacteraceae bacterium AT-5844]
MSQTAITADSTGPAPSFRLGLFGALATVAMWATWIIGSRFAMQGGQPLSTSMLAFVRFGTAALVLAPWWWGFRIIPRGVPKLALLGLLFAGLPYQFLVLWGLHFAPLAEAGPLLAGTLPLFIGILSVGLLGERLSSVRLAGIALITLGVAAITGTGLADLSTGNWQGHLLILAAAFSWSVYTIAFRHSGLTGVQAAAFVGFWSVVVLLPFGMGDILTGLRETPAPVLLKQVLVQGIMAGVVALITFTTAVRHLGAARTSAITALTPVMVVLIAILLLGDRAGLAEFAGCALIATGVVAASGAIRLPGARGQV